MGEGSTLAVSSPSSRTRVGLANSSTICGLTETRSPAMIFELCSALSSAPCFGFLPCAPALSAWRDSSAQPSTCDAAADGEPAVTCSEKGEPGKATRSPLP